MEKERKKESPDQKPDGTRVTREDRAEKKGWDEPMPRAPTSRRHEY